MTSAVSIVTGGRRGLGRAICEKLAQKGHNVLVVDVERDAAADETVALLRRSGVNADFLAADVGDEALHDGIIGAAGRLGAVTTLVNNAGVSSTVRGDMLDLPVESLDRAIRINLRAPFLLSQKFGRHVIKTGAATEHFCSIVNITSVNAEMIGVNRPDYCITKNGLSMATRLFAARLAEEKIHAYEVRPGIMMTEMTQPSREKYDRVIEEGLVPMRRWGTPADVGEAVAELATGAFKFSTGDAVFVDGGLHLYRL